MLEPLLFYFEGAILLYIQFILPLTSKVPR